MASPVGKGEAEQSAGESERQALGKYLANEGPAACADGDAHAQFMAAGRSTSEHQVREVDAGNEQDQSDDAGKHVKGPLELGAQVPADAFCRR